MLNRIKNTMLSMLLITSLVKSMEIPNVLDVSKIQDAVAGLAQSLQADSELYNTLSNEVGSLFNLIDTRDAQRQDAFNLIKNRIGSLQQQLTSNQGDFLGIKDQLLNELTGLRSQLEGLKLSSAQDILNLITEKDRLLDVLSTLQHTYEELSQNSGLEATAVLGTLSALLSQYNTMIANKEKLLETLDSFSKKINLHSQTSQVDMQELKNIFQA